MLDDAALGLGLTLAVLDYFGLTQHAERIVGVLRGILRAVWVTASSRMPSIMGICFGIIILVYCILPILIALFTSAIGTDWAAEALRLTQLQIYHDPKNYSIISNTIFDNNAEYPDIDLMNPEAYFLHLPLYIIWSIFDIAMLGCVMLVVMAALLVVLSIAAWPPQGTLATIGLALVLFEAWRRLF